MEEINYTELYRQNYEDALDEIRNLKYKIAVLEEQILEQEKNTENTKTEFDRLWNYNFYQPVRDY